jgi:tRNA(fMet)-specific endonuclease VapC
MPFLLDTNTCSDVLKGHFGVAEKLSAVVPSDVHVCAITIAEAHTGALKSQQRDRWLAAWSHFLAPFAERILPFDHDVAERYGAIRANVEREGRMIGDRDCMIAAIAQLHALTVVTSNRDEFERVSGLSVEDWRRHHASGG